MKFPIPTVALILVVLSCTATDGFVVPQPTGVSKVSTSKLVASSVATDTGEAEKTSKLGQIRKEGGIFSFNTPVGALNPFAIYSLGVSIFLGIPWFLALTFLQVFYKVTGNRFDKQRKLAIFASQVWGTTLMTLTRCWPKFENMDILKKFYKE